MMTGAEAAEYKSYLTQNGFTPQEADEYMAQSGAVGNAQSSGSGGAGQNTSPSVIQEMHPDVTEKERLIVKNFANSPESGVNYLKQQLPGHDIKYENGQYLVRRPDETSYRVVDPDTGVFSTDSLRDLGDVLYDAGSGVAQGAAEAGGAFVGNLPGAVAAGAGAGAGLEAIRQKLGQYLGIPQNVNPSDVAVGAAAGAIAPAVLGAGESKGLVQGAYDTFRNKVFPQVARLASGVPSSATKTLLNHYDEVTGLTAPEVLNEVQGFRTNAKKTLTDAKLKVGDEIGQLLDTAGGVDTSEARTPILDEVAARKAAYNRTGSNADYSAWKNAEQRAKDIFGLRNEAAAAGGEEIPAPAVEEFTDPLVSGPDAMRLKDQLGNEADAYKLGKPSLLSRHSAGAPVADKQLSNVFLDAQKKLGALIDNATEGRSGELSKKYGQISEDLKYLNNFFGTDEKTYQTLGGLDKDAKKVVQQKLGQIDKRYGLNLQKQADKFNAYKYFGGDVALTPLSAGGATSTSRSIPLAMTGALAGSYAGHEGGLTGLPGIDSATGALVGGALGGLLGSPAMIRMGVKGILKAEEPSAAVKAAIKKGLGYLPFGQAVNESVPAGLAGQGAKSIWQMMARPYYPPQPASSGQ